MKKVYLFAALTAGLVLASCSSDDLGIQEPQPKTELNNGAVGFDVYTQKATSRAGWTGSVTTSALKEVSGGKLGRHGFGVFGYYTDNNEYEQRSVPNFMYNQQVKWDGTSAFTYEPVVYWPNEYGDKAISDDSDKLTFFAYAPFVNVVPSSGKIEGAAADKSLEQWGITGMTKNTSQGDPILKYIGSFDNTKSVDLCWGVADNGDGAAWSTTQTGNPQAEIKNGMPWIDLERPAGVNQKVRFTFKHATAQMRVSIDADIDVDGHGHDNGVTKKTRIWVRQVTFKGFTMKGSLNLNNDDAATPKWLDYNGQNELVAEDVVIYDGRKDGKEGVAGAVATNEKSLGLNPALIQDGVYTKGNGSGIYDADYDILVYGVDANGNQKSDAGWARPGVTEKSVNLFKYNNDNNKSQKTAMVADKEFFHVIPVNDNFEVEIVYDVETVDQNLAQNLSDGAAKGSSIENRISKTISFGNETKLQPGHSYTLALHLGMNSVKFDAAVTDWIEEAAQDVDLPLNTPVFAAGSPATVTIPYTGAYTFALTGLHGQETMTATAGVNTINEGATTGNKEQSAGFISSPSAWTATANNAWTNGTALQTLEAKTNPNTTNQIQKVTWTGNQSGIATEMTFIQKAHPLYMAITAATGNTITLTRYNDVDHIDVDDWQYKYGWLCGTDGKALDASGDPEAATPANGIAVYRNGSKLSFNQAASLSGKEFDFTDTGLPTGSSATANESTATITIADVLKSGDVIKVVLKTGDAPVETVTCKVP